MVKHSVKNFNIEGLEEEMFLHAKELGVPDIDGITIRIKCPMPNHMINACKLLNLQKTIGYININGSFNQKY